MQDILGEPERAVEYHMNNSNSNSSITYKILNVLYCTVWSLSSGIS